MKKSHARWLVLACFVLAGCLVCSCDEDSTTCPPKVCPDPEKALLGTWTVFEAHQGDTPTPQFIGTLVIFEDNDSVTIAVPSYAPLQYVWVADGEEILMANPQLTPTSFRWPYELEADTLSMQEMFWEFSWRLHK